MGVPVPTEVNAVLSMVVGLAAESENTMVFNFGHRANALALILVHTAGIVIEGKTEHPSNADWPIEVTVVGTLTEVSLTQFTNALSPIVVTAPPDGNVTDVKAEQP